MLCSLFFCSAPLALHADRVNYSVEFEGLKDDKALKAIKSISQLTSLKKRPPASINALRYRAESDIPELIKVLHAHGYYEAKVNVRVQEILNQIHVFVLINPGPRYHLEDYQVHLYCESPEESEGCCPVPLIQESVENFIFDKASAPGLQQTKSVSKQPMCEHMGDADSCKDGDAGAVKSEVFNRFLYNSIGVKIGKPALTEGILSSELKLLQTLSECGFPLAQIDEREVIVDGKTKGVQVYVSVKTGEKATFGPSTITGLRKVNPLFIERKTDWTEGDTYNSALVEETQTKLLDSGLFSSVLIRHEEAIGPDGQIPMKIEVSETKHQSINVGVSYQTVFGPGITFGWENRNVGRMGRRLSFQGDITRISHSGIGTYLHPDFLKMGQDYICQGQAMHESLFAYSMRSYSIMNRFDRKIGKRIRFSWGLQGERLYVTASVHNGNYWLAELPLYFRYSTANSLLNPTKGITFEYTTTPSLNVSDVQDFYLINQVAESTYHPLNESESIVLAQQLTVGSILSEGLSAVPVSKRYLGGSEQDLRGYRYRTVSPLHHHKPIGGRSAIYFTFEARWRVTKTIGLVPFLDLGSVYETILPTWHGKWYKSTGIGLRYFSFIGPFRIDLAFPLDRRKGIDPVYKVLVSIGQTF